MSVAGLNLLFAGSGAFGIPTLAALIEAGANVTRVYTQPSRPAGRGNKLTPTPIGAFAAERGLPLTETPDLDAIALPPADAIVVIAFGQKLGPHVVAHAPLGAINLHASRLPKYRGAAPIHWAVINGDATAGNSVIRLAQRMDAGAVLAMSELAIGPLETTGELHDRLAVDGASLVLSVLSKLRDGSATPIEQDHAAATRAPKLSREASVIDWARPAAAIASQIRGMHPWPGCRVRLLDANGVELDRLTLVRARPTSANGAAGAIADDGSVGAGVGSVDVVDVHPDGKRPLALDAYRRGGRWRVGARLEPAR